MREGDMITRSESTGGQVRTAAGPALAADALQAAIEAAVASWGLERYEASEDEVQAALDALADWGFEVRAIEAEAAPSVGLPAEAYEQGHRDRYQRDREPDILCVNCGQPWAIKTAAPEAGLPTHRLDGLDVDLVQRVMFRLVGTSHVPDLDTGGVAFLAHREFAELFAAEYARLRDSEASPIPPPLPGRSCRHGIVHDQCPYCDSPGAEKEEATRRAIQRDSEPSDPHRLDR